MVYQRVVILGGASALWAPRNLGYMAAGASFQAAEVVLVDVAVDRAREMADVLNRMLRRGYPGSGLRVTTAACLADALPGADAVFTCFRNGGHDTEERLNAISARYGSRQSCYTAGPGACLYLAVQGPVLIDLVQRMQQHCPNAWLVNCSNPLPAMVMLAVRAGHAPRRVLGFCGALHWTRRILARFLDVAPERLAFRIGGTNHCTFITEVSIDGTDAYPRLRQRAREQPYLDLGVWGRTRTEIKLLEAVGYLCPGGHTTDIFPGVQGEWSPAPAGTNDDPMGNKLDYSPEFPQIVRAYAAGQDVAWAPPSAPDVPVSWLEALAGAGGPAVFSINTPNLGTVPNLPDWAVPDLECRLGADGVTPLPAAPLPEVIAETVRRHQVTFDLAARAVLLRDRVLLQQAIQLCPGGEYWETASAMLDDARRAFGAELIP